MAKANKSDFPQVDGVNIICLIGKGNFSRVYKGFQLNKKDQVAVKVIEKSNLTKGKVNDIISEIGIMKSLNHPHIVRLVDFKWDAKAVYIILQYCEGGNLLEYIKLHKRLRENVCKRALQQLASGLAYLRSKNICHMDLKPQNILMKFEPFTLKIADFGLAQYIPDEIYKDNLRGSPLYMAPEILLKRRYNFKVDLWSVGIILYECLFGRAPLSHKNCDEFLEALKNETPIKFPGTVPITKECKDLLEGLLVYNPDNRINYDDFFNHPFVDLLHMPSEENKHLAFQIIQEAVKLDEKKEYLKAFNCYCRALRYLVPILDTLTASGERAYYQLKISEYLYRAEELKTVLYREETYKKEVALHWPREERMADNEMRDAFINKILPKGHKDITSLISSDTMAAESDSLSHYLSLSQSSTAYGSISSDFGSKDYQPASITSSSSEASELSAKDNGSRLNALDYEKSSLDVLTEYTPQNIKELFSNIPNIKDALDIGYVGQMYMTQGDYNIAYQKYESSLSILIPYLKSFPPGFKRDLLVHHIRKWLAQAESAKTLASAKAVNCSENLKHGVEIMENCSIQ